MFILALRLKNNMKDLYIFDNKIIDELKYSHNLNTSCNYLQCNQAGGVNCVSHY